MKATAMPVELTSHGSFEWRASGQLATARYVTDYEILSVLGEGAFAKTYKVRNRFDSRDYAMKAVQLEDDIDPEQRQRVLREVEVLSSLSSEHVVRYYNSWIEKGDMAAATANAGGSTSEFTASASTLTATAKSQRQAAAAACTCNLCSCKYQDWEVSLEEWGLLDAVLQPLNLCTPCYLASLPHELDPSAIRTRQTLSEYLFIVMELCDATLVEAVLGLRDCGETRESIDQQTWALFGQCANGLAHLHSQGVIHRDIKPNNIFVVNGVVKIGDLGLAKYVDRAQSSIAEVHPLASSAEDAPGCILAPDTALSASTEVGTFLYTAPEVATGRYNESCDVYSLGVVLVEVFSDFSTGMERAAVLGRLRKEEGVLPAAWAALYPTQATLARKMVAHEPSARLSCAELLAEMLVLKLWAAEPLSDGMHLVLVELNARLAERDRELARLRKLLAEHAISDKKT